MAIPRNVTAAASVRGLVSGFGRVGRERPSNSASSGWRPIPVQQCIRQPGRRPSCRRTEGTGTPRVAEGARAATERSGGNALMVSCSHEPFDPPRPPSMRGRAVVHARGAAGLRTIPAGSATGEPSRGAPRRHRHPHRLRDSNRQEQAAKNIPPGVRGGRRGRWRVTSTCRVVAGACSSKEEVMRPPPATRSC